jgi:L-methionine (R)-S-oxide reductase
MNESVTLQQRLRELASSIRDRQKVARQIARSIGTALGYRWVGVYEVGEEEIFLLGWHGPHAPAHPRFPRTRGLCGQAVVSRAAVLVDDVTNDPEYLDTLDSTRSELVVPVMTTALEVVGVIDVESDRVAAFGDQDVAALESCTATILPLWAKPR